MVCGLLVIDTVSSDLNDVNENAPEIWAALKVILEAEQAGSVVAVAQAVPDLQWIRRISIVARISSRKGDRA